MAGLGSSGGRTLGTRDVPLDGRIAIIARVRAHETIPPPHSGRSPVVGSSLGSVIAGVVFDEKERGDRSRRARYCRRRGRVWVQRAVDKVGDGIRFHSIIVGESKSVRVRPLSSSARDWGTSSSPSSLLVVCPADSPAMGVTMGGECVDTGCRLQTTTNRESVRKMAEAG